MVGAKGAEGGSINEGSAAAGGVHGQIQLPNALAKALA